MYHDAAQFYWLDLKNFLKHKQLYLKNVTVKFQEYVKTSMKLRILISKNKLKYYIIDNKFIKKNMIGIRKILNLLSPKEKINFYILIFNAYKFIIRSFGSYSDNTIDFYNS